jgi:putative NADH-flavin reductase
MSTIAVVGVTGYAGGHITNEALRRGHEVIGICRSNPPDSQPGLTIRVGTITDEALLREVAAQAAALVIAVHGAVDDAPFLPQLVPSLLDIAGAASARLGFVGGAGSLLVAPGGPRLVDTPEFPAMFKVEAESHANVLEALRSADTATDWFYVSPAAGFGGFAPGERTGSFRTGGDLLLTDADGNSQLSGADYAIAFVDEIDKSAHHRQRFSVAY